MSSEEPIWSVTDVNTAIRELLENSFRPFWLSGEIGTLNIYPSGHVYLTLKDTRCQIRAVWWRGAGNFRELGLKLGDSVEAFGSLGAYEVRGEYQFNIRNLRAVGMGNWQRLFEETRRRLEAEGLLDPARKRALPAMPRSIGVITSPAGAAIRDFCQICKRRSPGVKIRIYPAAMQGLEAVGQILGGLDFFNRPESGVDLIVLTRGGGSMEDLQCFNSELLGRALAGSRLPVVSAIGHEIDFTIADFAADLRAPTPSGAAELVVPESGEMAARVERSQRAMQRLLTVTLQDIRHRLNRMEKSYVFREPEHLLRLRSRQLDELTGRMDGVLKLRLERNSNRLAALIRTLRSMNPEGVLERGYALIFDTEGNLVTQSTTVPSGKALRVRLADGEIAVHAD